MTHVPHWIELVVLTARVSVLCPRGMPQGDITTLAGVYTFSFLGVMTLFSVGTILLKFKRPSLPREVTVSYGTTLVGITCVSQEVVIAIVRDVVVVILADIDSALTFALSSRSDRWVRRSTPIAFYGVHSHSG